MIWIITTGGTIEGHEYDDESKNSGTSISIKSFLQNANISFKYHLESAFSKDSRFITPEDRELLLEKVVSSTSDKILITHGTITMVETANYLGKLNLNKTIVLVGSFISGLDKNTDAPFNLGYALSALRSLDKGVYIAMNGNVFTWDKVRKNVKQNRFE